MDNKTMNEIKIIFDKSYENVELTTDCTPFDLIMCSGVLIDLFAKEAGVSHEKALKAVKAIFKNFNIDSKPGMFGEEE